MPFDGEFDDVYASIRAGVEGALPTGAVTCLRLDKTQPAGRLTERLLGQIQAATICVADLTGTKPNVMWEVGYAMALGKPTLVVTQEMPLPFDIDDMQALKYSRNHLNATLADPLRRMVLDTVQHHRLEEALIPVTQNAQKDELVGSLLEEVLKLKTMISKLVKGWSPGSQAQEPQNTADKLSGLEGAWINTESGSHLYAKVIGDDLVAPYCYRGDNDLTGVYYGWKQAGEYWFSRFSWLDGEISGFSFLRQESLDVLSGAWWLNEDFEQIPETPIHGSGVQSRLERLRKVEFPAWAERFLADVRRKGLEASLAGIDSGDGEGQ